MINLSPSTAGASASAPSGVVGVYVHFPWCIRKCPYCDFASFEAGRDDIDHSGYADAVLRELAERSAALEGRRLGSLFIGGGTPSLWQPGELGRVVEAVRACAGSEVEPLEVTVECNPSSLDERHARELMAVGVNRLSIGVQSFDDRRLAFLGRLHDAAGGERAVKSALAAGVPRVSLDLMFAVAGAAGSEQCAAEAVAEAQRASELGVGHLSDYALTIEPATRFGELQRAGRLPLVSETTTAESFLAVSDALERAGFEHYEISNYARAGERSEHNLGYWRGHDYLGLGCAAFGTLSRPDKTAMRYRNAPNPTRYLGAARAGDFEPHEREELTPETRLRERIMLGLRLREGLDLVRAADELEVEAWPRGRRLAAEQLIEARQLERDDGQLRIPRRAWLFADGIAARLF